MTQVWKSIWILWIMKYHAHISEWQNNLDLPKWLFATIFAPSPLIIFLFLYLYPAWSLLVFCDRSLSILSINICQLILTCVSKCVYTVCSAAQSCLTLWDPMDCWPQAPLIGFSTQEYWSHWSQLPFAPPRDSPTQGSDLCLLAPALARHVLYQWAT